MSSMMAAAVCVPLNPTCCVRVGALRSTDVDCVLHATQNREHDPVRRGPGLTTTFLPPSHAASTTKSRTSSKRQALLGLELDGTRSLHATCCKPMVIPSDASRCQHALCEQQDGKPTTLLRKSIWRADGNGKKHIVACPMSSLQGPLPR